MAKDELKLKWNWKVFWIVVLVILWLTTSYSYIGLENEYNNYQTEVQKQISDLQLELTREAGNINSNYDCYERGTKECYDIGSVDCYDKGTIGEVQDKLSEFLLTHDCYDRGYFANKFCYDQPCSTSTCQSGYRLACVQN